MLAQSVAAGAGAGDAVAASGGGVGAGDGASHVPVFCFMTACFMIAALQTASYLLVLSTLGAQLFSASVHGCWCCCCSCYTLKLLQCC